VATWQQVKSYILSNYQIENDNGEMMSLMFDTGNGRSQRVFVGLIEAGALSSVRFSSPFASWSSTTAERALRATENVLVPITSIGDYLAATHSQLLATIDEAEIDWPMSYVASGADQLEQALGLKDQF
jgi:hypothetical protein